MPGINRTSDLGSKGLRNIADDAVMPATITIGNVSSTELSYLDGVTSAVQTQLNTKINLSGGNFTGNVGFGVASPSYKFEVSDRVKLRSGANSAGIWYTNSSGTEQVFGGLIGDTEWGVYVSGAWRFSVTSTTFYITSTNITLGGTGTNAVYVPYTAMAFNRLWDNYPGIMIYNDTTWGPVGEFRIHGFSGPSGGDFGINLRIDGGAYYSSDARMKTDVSTIDNALDIVKSMRGVRYRRMNRSLEPETDSNIAGGLKFGFIAQEVSDVAPEAVVQTPNHEPLENGWSDEFAVDYGSITPLLVEAIKALNERVESLETKQ